MFSRIRNFAERHHRKFLIAGALVGGGMFLKRYVEQKLLEWQEREMNQLLDRSRKQQHFESTERTCNLTITSVLPQLQTAIGKTLDSDSITLLLKQKAPNKKELWEQLKVIAFSRIISYVYCNSILAILLRTQVNILGAYLYLANQNPTTPDLELSPEAQGKFLSASNHWLGEGVSQFCQIVEKLTLDRVAGLSLKDRLTLVDLEKVLREIHLSVEEELARKPDRFFVNIVLPATDNSLPTVTKMLTETREVLESKEVNDLLTICTKSGMVCVLDKLSENLSGLAETNESKKPEFVHPNQVAVYLAKLIPVLNNFIFQDAWTIQLLTIEPLRAFGANIYESFST